MKRPAGWVHKSNLLKRARKDAIIALCRIAEEVGTSPITTEAKCKHVQKLLTKLQGHGLSDDATVRLCAAAEAWRDNGGHLQGELVPAPNAEDTENGADIVDGPPIPAHRVLLPKFKVRSHAFMSTYNSPSFTKGVWPEFLSSTRSFAKRHACTAWAACLEETLHPKVAQPTQKYHLHRYFYCESGDGIRLANTDELVFRTVRPRIDACTVTNPTRFKAAAMRGLWYVATRKHGGVAEDSNYMPWRNYNPSPDWLDALWGQHKHIKNGAELAREGPEATGGLKLPIPAQGPKTVISF